MALCSLSTGSSATPRARAAVVTSSPAITSTSLLASAMVLPASMAASTASSAVVPDEAHSTMSTSGCVATSINPSAPPTTRVPAGAAAVSDGTACRSPMAAMAGRYRSSCAASASTLRPAASPTTRSRSGYASITASALVPIEPVEPRIATRFTTHPWTRRGAPDSRRESPATGRRCGRGLLRDRGSSASCPSVAPPASTRIPAGRR